MSNSAWAKGADVPLAIDTSASRNRRRGGVDAGKIIAFVLSVAAGFLLFVGFLVLVLSAVHSRLG